MHPDTLDGRALDAAIARDLFGLEVEERTNTRTKTPDWVCREPGKQWVRVAFYTASLSASVKVELELARRGWKRRERTLSRPPTPATVVLVHADGRTVEAGGTSFGEVLCRAALKALANPVS